ncbi:unknown protein [Bathycoccus prasinos]|uniref:Uncharacterized protein n=1 Tax=Bathycoccus prasinos TaxID=41875 RepID=K8ERU0_9CHLO|nr:unknown protein [Bathycoccus prasinos]CCO20679.1 unknown protein [Bathycoccus prasinos]|eukprot:XP_007508188.1 unknown protein [Bathycoccus prasinos]
MTTKKKEDNDAKKGGNSYEVDAKYSFKDLVSVSPPSWQLFSGNGRDDDDVKEDKKEEKKTKKERTPTKPSMSLNVAIEDEERRKTPIKKKALMTSKSKTLSMKPKLGKMSFVDAFFLPGELERVKRKSREWGAAAWSARGDTTKDEDFEEVRRKRDIQKQLLSEWHQTVEKFRDDYKAKRKAAYRRGKDISRVKTNAANKVWQKLDDCLKYLHKSKRRKCLVKATWRTKTSLLTLGTSSAPKSEYKTTPREKKGGAKKNQRRITTIRSIRGRDDDDERERKREKQKRCR